MEKLIHTAEGKLKSTDPLAPGTRVRYDYSDIKGLTGIVLPPKNGVSVDTRVCFIEVDKEGASLAHVREGYHMACFKNYLRPTGD